MVMTLKRIRKEKIRKKMRKGEIEGKPVRHESRMEIASRMWRQCEKRVA